MNRFTKTLATSAVLAMTANAASAATFTLDGIYSTSNDMYTHQFSFPLILDNGTPVGSGELKVGIGANADGVTGGANDLFIYLELPLNVKDMTWGANTHDAYGEELGFDKNTGSEKVEFEWNGETVQIKLKQANGVGHEIKDESGSIVAARTSLDYIMNNFSSAYWGNGTDSPELVDDINGNDTYETVDPLLADWAFHQSWEIQIAGPFVPADLANLLTSGAFFGADFGGDNPKDSNFNFHASPTKYGGNADIVPDCDDPADCPLEEIPPTEVPAPAALPAGLALIGLTISRRRRK